MTAMKSRSGPSGKSNWKKAGTKSGPSGKSGKHKAGDRVGKNYRIVRGKQKWKRGRCFVIRCTRKGEVRIKYRYCIEML